MLQTVVFAVRVVLLQVLDYLYADDVFSLRMVNQASATHVTRLGRFFEQCVYVRFLAYLSHKLRSWHSVPDFLRALYESNATVTGSLFLELLLGQDKFRAKDMDLFCPDAGLHFPSIARWLFEWSTCGIPSKPNYVLSPNEEHVVRHVTEQDYDSSKERMMTDLQDSRCNMPPWDSEEYRAWSGRRGWPQIINVWQYNSTQRDKGVANQENDASIFQVITLQLSFSSSAKPREEAHRSIDEYISTNFDYEVTLGTIRVAKFQHDTDEQEKPTYARWELDIKLPSVGQACRRELVVNEPRQRRWMFMAPHQVGTYQKRLARYQARGFHLAQPLEWMGKHYREEMKSMPFTQAINALPPAILADAKSTFGEELLTETNGAEKSTKSSSCATTQTDLLPTLKRKTHHGIQKICVAETQNQAEVKRARI